MFFSKNTLVSLVDYARNVYDFFVDICNVLVFSSASEAVDHFASQFIDFLPESIYAVTFGPSFDLLQGFISITGGSDMPFALFIFTVLVAVVILVSIFKLFLSW